jgi:hypothetical protein
MWVNMGSEYPSTLAMAHIWYNEITGNIFENDVEFNDDYAWSASPSCPPGYYDVQSVGLHEFGHWLFLGDLYGPGDADKAMYGYGYSGQTKRALTADDIAGIRSIYGTSAPDGTEQLIIGSSTIGTSTMGGGYVLYAKYTATNSGNINQIRVYSLANGHAKVAIYSDNGGEPGSKLISNDTPQAVSASQWNSLSLSSTALTQGTAYWMGICIDNNGAASWVGNSGTARYIPVTYSSFTFPPTAGTGFTNTTAYMSLAGWGTIGTTPLSITTISLADGAVGTTYSQTLQAIGGTGSYTWSISLGSLPAGLTLNPSTGLISGVPTTAATTNFTAQVNDGSTTATQPLSITINVATQLIIGSSTIGTNTMGGGYVLYAKYTATNSGNVNQIRVYSLANGHAKVAIYSDNGGEPGSKLISNDTPQAVSASQWNSLSLSSTALTQGTVYWIGICIDNNGAASWVGNSGTARFIPVTYSSFTFPPTAGTSFTNTTVYMSLAGWGSISLPTPPEPPSPLSPGATITFKWGTSTGATTYWLQVNTASDFSGTNVVNAEVGNVTTQEVTGFSLGTAYYWRVKAGNSSGWSAWSSVRSVVSAMVP